MTGILVRFSRAGGRAPSDDELLEVRADGTFHAHRTVGGARIGAFAGRLPGPTLGAVERAAAACRAVGELWLETPRDGATETIELGDDGDVRASLGSNARPRGPWGALVTRLRQLLERVTDDPVAAVELVADTTRARLVPAGGEPIEVDAGTIELWLVHLDAAGVPVARRGPITPDPARTPAGWQRTDPGWSVELPFDRPVELAPGEWLQVRLTLRFRTDAPRRGRLFVAIAGAAD